MMKSKVTIKTLALLLVLATGALPVPAQQVKGTVATEKQVGNQGEKQQAEKKPAVAAPAPTPGERLEPDDTRVTRPDESEELQANRVEQRTEEEAAVVPYYNNFLTQYRLGPEDVISVSVFGHDRYSRQNITIPPDGILSYPLIPEGIRVVGKTTQQVRAEIAKYLDEYIIDPQVTVTLEKAQSMRYAVMGDVGQPGVRLMTRRLTVYEALLDAGGVLGTGNKKKVLLVRHGGDRMLTRQVIDVAAIEKGKIPDNIFLASGDQIFVPGNRMNTVNKILEILPVISFARIFTGGW
jgi:polysaccharide biosynthesis/export protein